MSGLSVGLGAGHAAVHHAMLSNDVVQRVRPRPNDKESHRQVPQPELWQCAAREPPDARQRPEFRWGSV